MLKTIKIVFKLANLFSQVYYWWQCKECINAAEHLKETPFGYDQNVMEQVWYA